MSGAGSSPQDTSYLEYDFLRIYERLRAYQYPIGFSLQELKPTIVKYYSDIVYGHYSWNRDWRIIFRTTEGEEVRFGYREPIKLTFIK